MSATATARAYTRWQSSTDVNEYLIEAFAQYQRSQGLADATIRNRRSILTGFARSLPEGLLDATVPQLRAWVGRNGIMVSTRRIEKNALGAFYAFAVTDGYLDESPADALPTVKVPRNEARPFTREQIHRMLVSGAYRRTRAMILLGYHQGFRVSQIAPVHGLDLDLESETIATIAKGGKRRLLPLHPAIAELATSMPETGHWFPAPGGGHIKPASVTDAITGAKRRAGIADPLLTPHSLRHSFGTDLVQAGVDIRVVQELMLHEDLSTTQIYTRVSHQQKAVGLSALETLPAPDRSGRRAA